MTRVDGVPSGGHGALPPRVLAEQMYTAALSAVHPERVTRVAVDRISLPSPPHAIHVLALGKAGLGMARAAIASIEARGGRAAGGVMVAAERGDESEPSLEIVVGDHPIPAARSLAAAARIGGAAAAVRPGDLALVLLSGGTSSLIAAPVPGLEPEDLVAATETLLAGGAPIGLVNRVRRRILRWANGRLADALAGARIECLVIADVPGEPPEVVGSGPCSRIDDPADALEHALRARGLWERLPARVREALGAERRRMTQVGPGSDPVPLTLLADNATARRAAAEAARTAGWPVVEHASPLAGEAAALGREIGDQLRADAAATRSVVHVWGGEPVVTLDGIARDAVGGRMQELALAAAERLDGVPGEGVVLLAAGTDGRDGPTDAAGAIVDGGSWRAIAARGRDPWADLRAHRSYAAHAAARSLLTARVTGTNVADIVIGVVDRDATRVTIGIR